jgi:signal transduction histidine kinase
MTVATNQNGEAGEEKQRARDRLATVGFIAALVSHPLRNRMASVRAVLELLEAGMEGNLSAEHRTLVLREFNAFIDDFNLGVEMVRCDFGTLETVSAREILDETLALFRPAAERKGIAIETDFAGGADSVRADRALLRQTVLNLLRNSLQALGATIAPRITLRAGREGDLLWIEVADNGPGVPADIHERLFIEAVTGRTGTTGLGLTLCRNAMTLMQGSIRYMTPKGSPGARFRVGVSLDRSGSANKAR